MRALLAASFLVTACAPLPDGAATLRDASTYTLVLLRTGPRAEPLSREESARHFAGHFSNMGRLAEAGDLLLAGPYGRQKSADDLRGIFVLATADRARARELAETDPCFQAGIFRFEYHDLTTAFPLRECAEYDKRRRAAAAASGKPMRPGDGARSYVLVTVADRARAGKLFGHENVVLRADLDGGGGLVLLDSSDHASASAMLAPFAGELGEHGVDEWFGTDALVGARRARAEVEAAAAAVGGQ